MWEQGGQGCKAFTCSQGVFSLLSIAVTVTGFRLQSLIIHRRPFFYLLLLKVKLYYGILKKHDIITAVYYFPPGFSLSLSLSFLNGSKRLSFHKRLKWSDGGSGEWLSECNWWIVNAWRMIWFGVLSMKRCAIAFIIETRLWAFTVRIWWASKVATVLCLLFRPMLMATVHLLENFNFLLFHVTT